MSEFTMTIDGVARSASSSFAVVNPALGERFADAPDCSREQLDDAMDAAQEAFHPWSEDDDARRNGLRQAADLMLQSYDELVPLLTAEQGKPFSGSREEIFGVALWLQYYADLEVPVHVVQDDYIARTEVTRRPMGVVVAITPWNYPLVLAAWKVAPALRAGNSVVLKPSPYTPLSTLKMVEIMNQALPHGVLNAVSGGDELGKWMTAHPVPRKVSFTGSVASGKHVAAAAVTDLKRVTLELGGNDPAILLDDVDPAAIADRLFWGAFMNGGQICTAIKRVYAPDSLYDAIVEVLAEKARSVKVGDGSEEDTEIGPINNEPQFRRVRELVDHAVSRGARVATGGRPMDRPGYFFEPTILADLSDGTRIVDEEQFGPALPVIPYSSVDDAVARANGTHFGLSASVWSADPGRATAVATKLECGTTWVNAHLQLAPHQPFGGHKWSGVGVENGLWGLDSFTDLQVRYVAR